MQNAELWSHSRLCKASVSVCEANLVTEARLLIIIADYIGDIRPTLSRNQIG
ncbi:MAG: hypothetical protein IJO24_08970 [Clostridia bacterium]|nr:hypothetical protein [Clostridia bacterium]